MSQARSAAGYVIIAFVVMIVAGCSSRTTVLPDNLVNDLSTDLTPVFISDYNSSGNPIAGQGILGLFTLDVDTQSMRSELTPLRSSSLIDSLEVIDLTNFLTLSPCRDCVKISAIGIDSDNRLIMTIGIKHPFKPGNPLLPISGKNRIDLHVFNVEGIIAITNPSSGARTFPTLDIRIAPDELLNPSGFTSYLDNYLDSIISTPSNAHPYILHFRDYTQGNYTGFTGTGFVDVFAPTGNLVMKQGSDYDFKDYVLNVELGKAYSYLFAVGCSYGVSTSTFLDRFEPEYRIPQYNKKAASEVFVTVKDNLLIQGNTSSTAKVEIKVLDMNHGTPVGTQITRMSADSSVAKITIEVPDIMTDPIYLDAPTPLGGDPRDVIDPLRYETTLTNELDAPSGTYMGLVAVEDAFPVAQNTNPFVDGMDGCRRVGPTENPLNGLFAIDKFVTYQIFKYDVQPSMVFVQKTEMPTPRSYARAAVVDDLIYVIGGTLGITTSNPRSDAVEAYNPISNTWETGLSPMPTKRAGMAVVAVGKKIYVIGGQLDSGSGNTDVNEVYDTETDTWATSTPMPGLRKHGLEAVAKDTIIYVAGGYNIADKDQKTLYRFDTTLESWGQLTDMVAARSQFAMTIKGDIIYVVGGSPVLGPGSNLTPYIEIYDTVSMSWMQPYTFPHLDTPVLGPRWEVVGGKIILVGGAIDATTLENRVLLYDEIGEIFFKVGELDIPRTQFASATWNDKIFLFGGIGLTDDDPPLPMLTPSTEQGSY